MKQRRRPRPWRVSLRSPRASGWTTNIYTTKSAAVEAAHGYRNAGWEAHAWHKDEGKPDVVLATPKESTE